MIYAQNNDADPNNKVDISVNGVFATVTIPPRAQRQFHLIWFNDTTRAYGVTPLGQNIPGSRVVAAWGTQPNSSDLMFQRQDDNVVQIVGDYPFDQDYGNHTGGDGRWRYRGNYGGWPQGHCNVIYLRAECSRRSGQGAGIAQINFASRVEEGTTNRPSMSFVTQVKGYTPAGGRDVSADMLRVVIDPNVGQLGVMINSDSGGLYLNSGFELRL
jgi:hypothetical protein